MILAVVGSVSLAGNADAEAAIRAAFDRHQPDGFTSGGAPGIDTMAEAEAVRRGIPPERRWIYEPAVMRWAPPGGFRDRNLEIARCCDVLVRIVASDATTYGSGWTRDRAREMGKRTEEVVIDAPR